MKRYRFTHPALLRPITYEAAGAREAKRMARDDVQQLRIPGWSGLWEPVRTSRGSSRGIKAWTLQLYDDQKQPWAAPGYLTFMGPMVESDPGPMDTHMAADNLLENLLDLREKLN